MIFTFSGTGNSYAVARSIADATGNYLEEVAPLVRYKRYTFDAEGKDVGFVFPTYYFGLPSMMMELAKNVVVKNPGRVFCVTTCGGASGGACELLAETLKGRLDVEAMYDVEMPDNAIFAFDTPSKDEAVPMLDAAMVEVESIIESLRNGDKGDMCRHKGDCQNWRELYAKYDEQRITEPFSINDRCVECRICAEICPEQVIKFYHRKPVWDEEKCSLCMGCVNMCPKQAIEYGESTVGRNRYYHPLFYEKPLGIKFKYEE